MTQEESDAIWMKATMYLAEIIKKDPERFKDCFEEIDNGQNGKSE